MVEKKTALGKNLLVFPTHGTDDANVTYHEKVFIEKILSMSVEERKNMGLAGRKKMEQEFDRNIVVEAYLNSLKYEMV